MKVMGKGGSDGEGRETRYRHVQRIQGLRVLYNSSSLDLRKVKSDAVLYPPPHVLISTDQRQNY